MKKIIILALSLTLFNIAMATEKPTYRVIESSGNMEIRVYDEYFVAKTFFTGNRSNGFRTLFNYISGANETGEKIEMTSPVTIKELENEKEMTFMIPSRIQESKIPAPTSNNIIIEKIPSRIIAANTYSWFASKFINKRKSKELKSWIESICNYTLESNPIYAGYDSPMTLPYNKRHEMMFVLKEK